MCVCVGGFCVRAILRLVITNRLLILSIVCMFLCNILLFLWVWFRFTYKNGSIRKRSFVVIIVSCATEYWRRLKGNFTLFFTRLLYLYTFRCFSKSDCGYSVTIAVVCKWSVDEYKHCDRDIDFEFVFPFLLPILYDWYCWKHHYGYLNVNQ